MRTQRKNEFGQALAAFTARTGMTIRDVAKACDVPYDSLLSATTGRRPGEKTVPIVRQFMESYQPPRKP